MPELDSRSVLVRPGATPSTMVVGPVEKRSRLGLSIVGSGDPNDKPCEPTQVIIRGLTVNSGSERAIVAPGPNALVAFNRADHLLEPEESAEISVTIEVGGPATTIRAALISIA
jgi:hypothetical protein